MTKQLIDHIEYLTQEAYKYLLMPDMGETDVDHVMVCLNHILKNIDSYRISLKQQELKEWTQPLC